jgi:O-antigen/teichoic acid export membrane protein
MIHQRLFKSAVAWSWLFNCLRLGSGLIVLPLVLYRFSKADFGMYGVLLSLASFVPIVDFGFGPTIGRFVSYAYGGAQSLQAHGVQKPSATVSQPNYALLWQLLEVTRVLYRYLALAILLVLGVWGTWSVESHVHETSSVLITRLAWATTLAAALMDIYWSWWNTYLNGLNQVTAAARIGVLTMSVKVVLTVVLLLSGAGLLSLPVAGLVSSFLDRQLARRLCLKLLGEKPSAPAGHQAVREVLRLLWPNASRLGIQFLSGYLTINANTQISEQAFGLAETGKYVLATRLLEIAATMGSVWTFTKWPLIAQYRARHEFGRLRKVFWPRIWLTSLTFAALAVLVVFLGPPLLVRFGHGKEMLPPNWMLLLAAGSFLTLQFSAWTTLIATQNRLPFLWPTVATNVLSLCLTLTLVRFCRDSLGLGALVLGPLIAGSLFNYWYWPFAAARSMETSLFRFLFRRPQ